MATTPTEYDSLVAGNDLLETVGDPVEHDQHEPAPEWHVGHAQDLSVRDQAGVSREVEVRRAPSNSHDPNRTDWKQQKKKQFARDKRKILGTLLSKAVQVCIRPFTPPLTPGENMIRGTFQAHTLRNRLHVYSSLGRFQRTGQRAR